MSNTSPKSTDRTAKPFTTISAHKSYIRRIAYLPGGERAVTCSYDGTVRIWDVEKGVQEGRSMMHGNRVRGLAVTSDGKRILSGGEDKRIRVWDVDTQQPIEELGSHTSADVRCLSLSPDGRLAASGDSVGNLVIREMKMGGETKHSIHAGSEVYSLGFSPNGEKLACGVHMGEVDVIKVYNVESGELVLGPINGHEKVVRCVLWSLYGSQLFSASEDRTIRCWDSETGESIGKPWTGHMGNVFSLSLSPDGTKVASASWDKTVRLWDTNSGDPIGHPLQHEAWLLAVTFSPSGEFVTSGGSDGKVSIWRVPWWESQKQAHRSLLATAWDLDEIRSNFVHNLTGYVAREGEDPIASGGFGDIYRGKLCLDGRSIDVAVKAIRTYSADDGDDAKKTKRLRRELKTWVNLKHVNILPLFGTTMGFGRFPAMVCPWLENGTLTSYLEHRHDTLRPLERLALLGDAAAGLQYLHSQSIVHGDLSGSNVLLDGDGRACISDFGLSMVLTDLGGPTYATSRHEAGTLRWAAPELLDFQALEDEENPPDVLPTPESDVYSFGRIMLQVLTGKVPYHYYPREARVWDAISKGIIPIRPDPPLVTARQWTFMQQCWMPVGVGEPRPHADKIVEFVRQELVDSEKATLRRRA